MTISGISTAGMSQQNAAAFASIVGVYDFALSSPPGVPLSYVHAGNTAGVSVYRVPGGGAARLNYDCANLPGTSAYGLGHFRFYDSGLEFTLGQQATWPSGGVTTSVTLMTIAGRTPTTIGSICGGTPTIWNRSQGLFGGRPTGAGVLYDFTIEIGLP